MTAPYRLHYAPDNASMIVRLVLEALRQRYEVILVDRAMRGQNEPAYLALNPNGLIPTLETPDGSIFETGRSCFGWRIGMAHWPLHRMILHEGIF